MSIDSLEEDILVEVNYVHSLAGPLWDRIGQKCKWDGTSLRHAGMAGSMTSASFIMWRLQYLHELPWTLCRGNIDEKLRELEEGPKPIAGCVELYETVERKAEFNESILY